MPNQDDVITTMLDTSEDTMFKEDLFPPPKTEYNPDEVMAAIPSDLIEGKSQSFVSTLKAKALRYVLERLTDGIDKLTEKSKWRSKINAMGVIGTVVAWFLPPLALKLGIPVDLAYQIFGSIFGGVLIIVRTWFTNHKLT